MAKNTPEILYTHPKSAYIASFFNEINEIPLHILDTEKKSKETVLLYPNQFKIVENSKLKATIISSYFKGNYYLIEADLKGEIIFFEHFKKLQISSEIYLKLIK